MIKTGPENRTFVIELRSRHVELMKVKLNHHSTSVVEDTSPVKSCDMADAQLACFRYIISACFRYIISLSVQTGAATVFFSSIPSDQRELVAQKVSQVASHHFTFDFIKSC